MNELKYYFYSMFEMDGTERFFEIEASYFDIYPCNTLIFVKEQDGKTMLALSLSSNEWGMIWNDFGTMLHENKWIGWKA
jgi:hypothetical protein